MDEDTLEYGKSVGIDDAIHIVAAWLEGDTDWIKHVVSVRMLSETCDCKVDTEYGNYYCQAYIESQKPVLTPEQQEQERKREEAWKAIHEAANRTHDEMIAKYQELGWLP